MAKSSIYGGAAALWAAWSASALSSPSSNPTRDQPYKDLRIDYNVGNVIAANVISALMCDGKLEGPGLNSTQADDFFRRATAAACSPRLQHASPSPQ